MFQKPGFTPPPKKPATPDMAKQKAQTEALKRHKPKRSPSGEFPAVQDGEK